jgi:hypothetical protein
MKSHPQRNPIHAKVSKSVVADSQAQHPRRDLKWRRLQSPILFTIGQTLVLSSVIIVLDSVERMAAMSLTE